MRPLGSGVFSPRGFWGRRRDPWSWIFGASGVPGAIALWRTKLPFTPPIRGKWVSVVGMMLAANVLLTHAATLLE